MRFLQKCGRSRTAPLFVTLLLIVTLSLFLSTSSSAQTIRVQNGATLRVSNDGVFRLESGMMDFGEAGATARLDEQSGGRVAGGTLEALRSLNGPSEVNVAGLGAEITASADLGEVGIQRGHAVQTGNGNESIERYYLIVPMGTNEGLNATLALHYADAELNGLAESDLELFRSTDQGNTWTRKGQDRRDPQENVVELDGIGAFSSWTLASESAPIPVELASFDAKTGDEQVRLSWTTASETNNAGFRIQRRDTGENGKDGEWTTVGSVEGEGTTAQAQRYRFTDEDLPYDADRLAYCLRQVDTDGSAHVSDEVIVDRDVTEVELLGTYPNPARQRATVRYALPEVQDVTVRLYDVLGRQVRTVVSGKQKGRHQRTLDVAPLPSGVYFLRLRAGGQTRTQKLTIVQ